MQVIERVVSTPEPFSCMDRAVQTFFVTVAELWLGASNLGVLPERLNIAAELPVS
jgi:hypothetical protein